ELSNLFVEEAREELTKISQQFPLWEQNPLEQGALVTVRRSFHTLKGSGRMVGARDLSEFAWAIENLLNRLLDNTLGRTPAITRVLHDAVAALPQLVEQLETGSTPRTDMAAIITRAHSLAAGRTQPSTPAVADSHLETPEAAPAAVASSTAGVTSAPEAPASGTATDDVLRDIYARET